MIVAKYHDLSSSFTSPIINHNHFNSILSGSRGLGELQYLKIYIFIVMPKKPGKMNANFSRKSV